MILLNGMGGLNTDILRLSQNTDNDVDTTDMLNTTIITTQTILESGTWGHSFVLGLNDTVMTSVKWYESRWYKVKTFKSEAITKKAQVKTNKSKVRTDEPKVKSKNPKTNPKSGALCLEVKRVKPEGEVINTKARVKTFKFQVKSQHIQAWGQNHEDISQVSSQDQHVPKSRWSSQRSKPSSQDQDFQVRIPSLSLDDKTKKTQVKCFRSRQTSDK